MLEGFNGIRDIEEDKAPADLASTFLRGYIRSMRVWVHIPEEELMPGLKSRLHYGLQKAAPMQSFSLGKRRRKKRDGWLDDLHLAGVVFRLLV